MSYVLLINADRLNVEVVASDLAANGIASWIARDEDAAIDMMQKGLPDIIVWDWPARTIAPEIFVAVLRQERFCGPLVICATGLDAQSMPYDVLIQKPVHPAYIVETIGRLVPEERKNDSFSSRDANGC